MFSAQPNYLNEFACVNQCLLHYYFEKILMRKRELWTEASHTDLNLFIPEKVMKVKAVLACAKPKNIPRTEANFCRIPSAGMLPPQQGVLAWVPSGYPTVLGTPWEVLEAAAKGRWQDPLPRSMHYSFGVKKRRMDYWSCKFHLFLSVQSEPDLFIAFNCSFFFFF